jgi:hypothetical protein
MRIKILFLLDRADTWHFVASFMFARTDVFSVHGAVSFISHNHQIFVHQTRATPQVTASKQQRLGQTE